MFSVLMEPVVHDYEGEVAYSCHWFHEEDGLIGCLLIHEGQGQGEM